MSSPLNIAPLEGRELAEYGAVRIRDQAFDAIQKLWRRRCDEGITQKDIADRIGMDTGQLSKVLRGPGNWTLRTIGALMQALRGEAELRVFALEDAIDTPSNFDAYEGYRPAKASPIGSDGFIRIVGIGPSLNYEFKTPVSNVASITVGMS